MSGGTLRPSPEVEEGLEKGRPVVALETSVLTHGLPEPAAGRAADEMEAAARDHGAIPAWAWTGDGALCIGASREELRRLMEEPAAKVARRDLPAVVASGALGGTTVSAALWAAGRVGIEVAATGGIGGVHPGTADVSADLPELARTTVTLVCSGPKSILDPVATVERLEELGVTLLGYRCERLPFFLVRESPPPLEHRAEHPGEVAAVIRARGALGIHSGLLVCNPVPAERALPAAEIAEAVAVCRSRAEADGVRGKDLTPYLLACLADLTDGATVEANLALLASNVSLAAEIARELSEPEPGTSSDGVPGRTPPTPGGSPPRSR